MVSFKQIEAWRAVQFKLKMLRCTVTALESRDRWPRGCEITPNSCSSDSASVNLACMLCRALPLTGKSTFFSASASARRFPAAVDRLAVIFPGSGIGQYSNAEYSALHFSFLFLDK